MPDPAAISSPLSPDAVRRWGLAVLYAAFGGLTLLILGLAWAAPTLLPFVPAALIALAAGWTLFRHPTLNFVGVTGGVVLLISMQEGFQVLEVVYGLYFLGYLAHWYALRLFFYREGFVHTAGDWSVVLFLIWMTLSLGLTILFNGDLVAAFKEWISLLMLAFYFPIKEMCERHRNGPWIVLGVVLWLGVFMAINKVVEYQQALESATQLWQIVRGRAASQEMYVLIPSLAALVLLLYVRGWKLRLVTFGAFLLYFGGLLLTQSRGYWADFAFGGLVLLVVLDRRRKGQLLGLGALGLTLLAGVGVLLLGDLFIAVASGFLDRFLSIGSAATADISLVNRFLETKAAWARIQENPIIGYGMGVSYSVYDITVDYTLTKAFIHNGFLSLWYRFGLIGLGLIGFLWFYAAKVGFQTYHNAAAQPWWRVLALIPALCLVALLPAANTSPPFVLAVNVFIFTVLLGWAAGMHARVRRGRNGGTVLTATENA